jgi:hypothetical protein
MIPTVDQIEVSQAAIAKSLLVRLKSQTRGKPMDTPYTSRNHRILTFTRKTRILHVENALEIGRLRFEIYRYQRGEGAQASVEHYLTYTDALPLLADLAHGTLSAPYAEQKGSLNQSKPVARQFTIGPGD